MKFPRRIRTIHCPRLMPVAWSLDEVRKVLDVSAKLQGRLQSGVKRPAFWTAFVQVGWHTGLRLGDLLELRRSDVADDGTLYVMQRKTRWPIMHRLPTEALAAILATYPPERERIFGDALSRRHVAGFFKLICDMAGVRSGTKMLRRSAATAIERAVPGGAMAFLGHLTPGLAAKHYIDPRHIWHDRPQPPRLTG